MVFNLGVFRLGLISVRLSVSWRFPAKLMKDCRELHCYCTFVGNRHVSNRYVGYLESKKESQRGQPYYPQAEHHQLPFSFSRALKARLGVDLFGFDATIGPGTNQTLRTTHRGEVSQFLVIHHFFKIYIVFEAKMSAQIQKQIILKF